MSDVEPTSPSGPDQQPALTRAGWLAPLLLRSDPGFLVRLRTIHRQLRLLSGQKRRWLMRRAAVTVAGAALLLALSRAPAMSDTITVANGEVAIADNGKCSLIEAIENANDTKNGRPYSDCAAGNPNGADTINLPQNGEFVLVEAAITGDLGPSGTPWIRTKMTINGNGSRIHRANDAPEFRIMQIGRKGDLTLKDAYIRNGFTNSDYYAGAGLYVQGKAQLTNVTVEGNNGSYYSYGCGTGISNSGTVTITDSSIQSNVGVCGAGLNNEGSMEIVGSTIIDNYAAGYYSAFGGGIENSGELTITDSSLTNNAVSRSFGAFGGALSNRGTATILRSTLSGNSAVSNRWAGGGAILNAGTLTVQESSFIGNTAYGGEDGSNGGAIHNWSQASIYGSLFRDNFVEYGDPYVDQRLTSGGAIGNAGTLIIANSTLSNNKAPEYGGGLVNFSEAQLRNVTFTRNEGGGLLTDCTYESASTWLSRTIISGNVGSSEAHVYEDEFDCSAAMVVDTSNLFGVSGDAGVNFPLGSSDIVPSVGLGSIMAPLADNGGPTMTHALVPGSPAIDRARSAACAGQTDQRGYARNADGDGQSSTRECDIGAYEYNASAPQPTATTTATPTATTPPTATSTPRPTNTPSPTPTMTPTGTITPPANTPAPTNSPQPSSTPILTASPTSPALQFHLVLPVLLNGSLPAATPTLFPTATMPTMTATVQPTTTNTPTVSPTQTAPSTATATRPPNPPGNCTVCDEDTYNCGDFATQAEAQACHDYCFELVGKDIHRLDQDGNGIACESLPYRSSNWPVLRWPGNGG